MSWLSDREEKEYYEKSEKALREMPKYEGNPGHNAHQHQPGGENKDSCSDKLLSLLFLAIAITSYFS